MNTHMSVHVPLDAERPRHHCAHLDGTHSFSISKYPADVYLVGTLEELHTFARALLDIAVPDDAPASAAATTS